MTVECRRTFLYPKDAVSPDREMGQNKGCKSTLPLAMAGPLAYGAIAPHAQVEAGHGASSSQPGTPYWIGSFPRR